MTYKVLVVDDVATIRGFVRAAINGPGREVHEASSGARALEVCHGMEIDLVVTDWNMPEMRGDELIRRIRANTPDMPVLVLSAEGDREIVAGMLALNIQGYVLKPFQLPALRGRVDALLQLRPPRSAGAP